MTRKTYLLEKTDPRNKKKTAVRRVDGQTETLGDFNARVEK